MNTISSSAITDPSDGADWLQPLYQPWGELLDRHPTLRRAIIEGLLRRGECMNIVSHSKAGKSWFVHDLAVSVATGKPWLGIFPTVQGSVLLVDNELHQETIADRLRDVARANGIDVSLDGRDIMVVALRGRLRNIHEFDRVFKMRETGEFSLVIFDALYRMLPPRIDENSNADMTSVYNAVDAIADSTGAGIALSHHASKGNQSDKQITDVGSGAGAGARAVDTHLVLRRHQEEGAYVLDFAVRSWPSPTPICLRWVRPLWQLAPDLDPADLWNGRKPKKDSPPAPEWDAAKIAALCTADLTPATSIVLKANSMGLSKAKALAWLADAVHRGLLREVRGSGKGGPKLLSRAPPIPPVGTVKSSYGYG